MFLNIAKHGEITTKIQFTGTQRNRNETGFFVNLIMTSTVSLAKMKTVHSNDRDFQTCKKSTQDWPQCVPYGI